MSASHSDTLRILVDEVDRQIDAAFRARAAGDGPKAREHLQRAGEGLRSLAGYSRDPQLKAQRLAQAERLGEMARAWDGPPEKGNRKPGPVKGSGRGDEPGQGRAFHPQDALPDDRFEDVIGLEDAKREIRLRMVLPFAHPDTARRFGLSTGGGLLLYGPPGTGKTLLARATAGELGAAFFPVKASDIASKWFGEAENNVANLFAAARSHDRAVIFIDELEALVPSRDGSNSSVMARLVPQFLAELDGFKKGENALLVIGATNKPWALDNALLRPGRIDLPIYVGLPTQDDRARLLGLLAKGKPLAGDVDLERLARMSEGHSGADLAGFVRRAAREGFEASIGGEVQPLGQRQLEALLGKTHRSVSEKELARFRRFREGLEGGG